MRTWQDLEHLLFSIDGAGYSSYKDLYGTYALDPFELSIDHVQVDPYAPPSLMRIMVERSAAAFPDDLLDTRLGRIGVADFLSRRFIEGIATVSKASGDTGPGGAVSMGRVGQQVLERTHVAITATHVEARIEVKLPASGRRVRGRQAADILLDDLPDIAERALLHANLDQEALRDHVTLLRDQEFLRETLAERSLVAFVGDGAILPRRSGNSDLPLSEGAVPFASPGSLAVSFDLPSGRGVSGMGIPEGVTVIVGGGYHGKSTLLRALERGVYPHIAGDGREWVIARADAVTIRAEDGRSVSGVDISPFISNLPSGTSTNDFSTTNASGSTSQAANLVEALEAGASTLLIDEDTSATNFMIRDERMRQLIPAEREPITPFVERIRPLLTESNVSTVLVAGGSGAFFDVADHVIALDSYRLVDVTAEARALADPAPSGGTAEPVFAAFEPRVPTRASLLPPNKTKPTRAHGREIIQFGKEKIDLTAVVQLLDPAQTQALAYALDRLAEVFGNGLSIADAVAQLEQRIDEQGLDTLSPRRGHPGVLARPRRHEIHAAVNRYRHLRLSP